jgi:hypothetical protein
MLADVEGAARRLFKATEPLLVAKATRTAGEEKAKQAA